MNFSMNAWVFIGGMGEYVVDCLRVHVALMIVVQ